MKKLYSGNLSPCSAKVRMRFQAKGVRDERVICPCTDSTARGLEERRALIRETAKKMAAAATT